MFDEDKWKRLKGLAREFRAEIHAASRELIEEKGPLTRGELLGGLRDRLTSHPRYAELFEFKANSPGGTIFYAVEYIADVYYQGGGGIIAFKTDDGTKFALRPSDSEDDEIDEAAAEEIDEERAGMIYAMCFPNDRRLAELQGRDRFEIKIGKAVNGDQRVAQHSAAARTAMHTLPEEVGRWSVRDRHAAERFIHAWLAYKGHHVEGGGGREWFLTNPEEVGAVLKLLDDHLSR